MQAPNDFDLSTNRAFALGWGVSEEKEDSVGAYIAMLVSNKNWGTMSVTSPFSV